MQGDVDFTLIVAAVRVKGRSHIRCAGLRCELLCCAALCEN